MRLETGGRRGGSLQARDDGDRPEARGGVGATARLSTNKAHLLSGAPPDTETGGLGQRAAGDGNGDSSAQSRGNCLRKGDSGGQRWYGRWDRERGTALESDGGERGPAWG